VQRDLEKRQYRHRIRKTNTFGFKLVTRKKFAQNDLFIHWSKIPNIMLTFKKILVTVWNARLEIP